MSLFERRRSTGGGGGESHPQHLPSTNNNKGGTTTMTSGIPVDESPQPSSPSRLLASTYVPPEHIVDLCVDHLSDNAEHYFRKHILSVSGDVEGHNTSSLDCPTVDRGLYILWIVFGLHSGGGEKKRNDDSHHTPSSTPGTDRLEVVSVTPLNIRTFSPDNKKAQSLIAAYAEAMDEEYEEDVHMFKHLPLKLRLSTPPPLRPPPTLLLDENDPSSSSMNFRTRLTRNMVCWFTVENEKRKPFMSKIVTVHTLPDDEEEYVGGEELGASHSPPQQWTHQSPSLQIYHHQPSSSNFTPSPPNPVYSDVGMAATTHHHHDPFPLPSHPGDERGHHASAGYSSSSSPARITPSYPRDERDCVETFTGILPNNNAHGGYHRDNVDDGFYREEDDEDYEQGRSMPQAQPPYLPHHHSQEQQEEGKNDDRTQLLNRIVNLEDTVANLTSQMQIVILALNNRNNNVGGVQQQQQQGITVSSTSADHHHHRPHQGEEAMFGVALPEKLNQSNVGTPCDSPIAKPPKSAPSASPSPKKRPPAVGGKSKGKRKAAAQIPATLNRNLLREKEEDEEDFINSRTGGEELPPHAGSSFPSTPPRPASHEIPAAASLLEGTEGRDVFPHLSEPNISTTPGGGGGYIIGSVSPLSPSQENYNNNYPSVPYPQPTFKSGGLLFAETRDASTETIVQGGRGGAPSHPELDQSLDDMLGHLERKYSKYTNK